MEFQFGRIITHSILLTKKYKTKKNTKSQIIIPHTLVVKYSYIFFFQIKINKTNISKIF